MPPEFSIIEQGSEAGHYVIAARGEIDLFTAPELKKGLTDAIEGGQHRIAIDLSEVSFLDSSGVHLLLRTRAVLGREDRALVIICPPGPARRIFEVAGIADLFALFESRDRAAASLQPPS